VFLHLQRERFKSSASKDVIRFCLFSLVHALIKELVPIAEAMNPCSQHNGIFELVQIVQRRHRWVHASSSFDSLSS